MQESRPTCTKWMSENCHWDGSDEDDDDNDDRYKNLDSVSEYTPAGSDVTTPGPYSVTSCPPSVGVDDYALMPTPYMYAPTSPNCVTPLKYSESDIDRSSDDAGYFSSAKKPLLLTDPLLQQQTELHRSDLGPGSNTLGHKDVQKAGFPRSNNGIYTEIKSQTGFFAEESPVFSRQETPSSSTNQVSESVSLEQTANSNPGEDRRMSLDEFVDLLSGPFIDTVWKEFEKNGQQNDVEQNISHNLTYCLAEGTNGPTPGHYKSTTSVRKRTAKEMIFSNPDFPDSDRELPAKRQKLIPGQTASVPDFQQKEIKNTDACVPDNNGIQGLGLTPHADNIHHLRANSWSAGQNVTHSMSPRDLVRALQFTSPDTGKLGPAVEQPQPSPQAASTSTNPTFDYNGNMVRTDSQLSKKHISPKFVGTTLNLSQLKALTSFNENICLRTTQPQTTFRSLSTQPNIRTPDIHMDLPHPAAILTTHFPQTIIPKLPEHHPDNSKPTVVHTSSDNQNFSPINEDIFQQQGIVPGINRVFAGLTYPDSQALGIPHQSVASCSGEAPSPATTSTSSHDEVRLKNICQLQGNRTSSHLFHRSAGPDHRPLETTGCDLPRPPTDAVTAQVFATDNTSLYQTQTLPISPAVLDNNGAYLIKDVMLPGAVMDVSPSNSLLPPLDAYHVTRPSPNVATHNNPDYLADTDVSADGSSVDQIHRLDAIQACYLIVDRTLSDVGTSFVWDQEQSFLADLGQKTDSTISTVELSGVTGSVVADRKLKDPGHVSGKVKQTLKSAILSKLQKEGKPAIEISFPPATHHELTPDEREKEKRRRELNRHAAANHRKKSKVNKQSQEQEREIQEQKNVKLKEEVSRLESQILVFKQLLPPEILKRYEATFTGTF